MATNQITLWMDGRIPICVDEEEFKIIKLMILEKRAGARCDMKETLEIVDSLVSQGYRKGRAVELVIMGKSAINAVDNKYI